MMHGAHVYIQLLRLLATAHGKSGQLGRPLLSEVCTVSGKAIVS